MKSLIVAVVIAVAILLPWQCYAQNLPPIPKISVTELPPEPIPAGTCTESYSGYLEIKNGGQIQKANLTAEQIGEYVAGRLGQGYSLVLYPQVSGRLFVIETCESKKR